MKKIKDNRRRDSLNQQSSLCKSSIGLKKHCIPASKGAAKILRRNFAKTIEPEGQWEKPAGRLKFVVQHYLARSDHFDLRLEWDGALLSWAVPKGPSYDIRDKRLVVQVEAHPLEYRNF